uniref:Cystatin domain-containing protein n=1 Tax=Acrobeloides nanus TaxID=290746 RepID=A0A914DES9_9BILA
MSMPGGFTEQDPNSQDVKDMVSRAMTQLNAQSNSLNYLIPIKIVSVQSQVVAGINYKINATIGKSTCLKNQVSAADFDSANCPETSENDRQNYTISVWQKPWENFEQFTFNQN